MRGTRPSSSFPSTCLTAALLAFALTGSTRAADNVLDANPTTRGNISVQLPAAWKPQPPAGETGRVLLAAAAPTADSDNTGDYAPVLVVTSAPGSTIDGDAQQKRLAEDFPSYQANETPTHININGVDAITFGGTFSSGSLKLRSRQYLLAVGGRIYTLTLTVLDSHWQQHIEAAVASIQTFKVATKP